MKVKLEDVPEDVEYKGEGEMYVPPDADISVGRRGDGFFFAEIEVVICPEKYVDRYNATGKFLGAKSDKIINGKVIFHREDVTGDNSFSSNHSSAGRLLEIQGYITQIFRREVQDWIKGDSEEISRMFQEELQSR